MRRPYLLILPLLASACTMPAASGDEVRLINSNPLDIAIEAVQAGDVDCATAATGVEPTRITVPRNGTAFIPNQNGADICWRERVTTAPAATPWSGWGRVYLANGTQSAQL